MAYNPRNFPPSKFAAVRAILGKGFPFSYDKSADTFHFPFGATGPPQAEIDAKLTELTAEYESKKYRMEREYPPIGDQLDMIYKDMKNGTTTHADVVEAVKSKYPKPE